MSAAPKGRGAAGGLSPGVCAWALVGALIGASTSQAGAAGSEAPAGAAAPLSLTVQQATLRALERSAELELARLSVEEKELALSEAEVGQLEGQPRRVLDQARQELQAARAAYVGVIQQVAARVAEAYYGLLRRQENLSILQQSLSQSERQWKLAQARFDAGLISRQELDEARDAYARAQEQLEAEKRAAAVELAAFRDLVGVPEGTPVTLVDTVAYEPIELDVEAAVERALRTRREVQDARRAVETAEEQVKASDNPYTPPVELERARLALERARLQLRQQEAAVRDEVRQQALALWSAQQKVEASRRARDLAAFRLTIARARYEAGQISLLDLLQAQADDASARLTAAAAVWDYQLALARWLRATGEAPMPPLPEPVAALLRQWEAEGAAEGGEAGTP